MTPYGDPEPDVANRLVRSKFGPRGSLDNIVTILTRDSRWIGRFRYNAFLADPEIDGRAVHDEDDGEIAIWLDRVYSVGVPSTRVSEGIRLVAHRSSYHPVRDWLGGLKWDGRPRLDTMLATFFGAGADDLNKRIGACWLISAVARVMQPGCKVDTSPIFVGAQGAMKSSAIKALAGPWFGDTPIAIGSKDAYMALRGVWIYELGELDSVKRAESSSIKAFLSSPVDRYRPSYGRYVRSYPRQVVIVGSTNEREFLRDRTGSRRFWPVDVTRSIDLAGITANRDQLWAEAVVRHAAGERWWLDEAAEADLRILSEGFRESDPWEPPVAHWVDGRIGGFTSSDVLREAVKKETAMQTHWDVCRIVSIMEGLGFVQSRVRLPGRQARLWGRPGVNIEALKAQAAQEADNDAAEDDPWIGRNAS